MLIQCATDPAGIGYKTQIHVGGLHVSDRFLQPFALHLIQHTRMCNGFEYIGQFTEQIKSTVTRRVFIDSAVNVLLDSDC